MLAVSPEKVCYIIMKAREFDVKEAATELNDGGHPSGDHFMEALEDAPGDPALEELVGGLRSLNREELVDVAALAWIGRGDFDAAQLDEARRNAAELKPGWLIRRLIGLPLLGDYLEEGLSSFGQSCIEFEANRL